MTCCIATHESHGKYDSLAAFHEAGYDSLLTAQVAVRLSTKLDLAGSHIEDLKDNTPPSPPDDGGGVELDNKPSTIDTAIGSFKSLLLAPVKALAGQTTNSNKTLSAVEASSSDEITNSYQNADTTEKEDKAAEFTETKSDKKKNKKKKSTNKAKSATPSTPAAQLNRFAHATAYDQLQDTLETSEDDTTEEVLQFDALPSEDAHASNPVVTDTDGVSDPRLATGTAWEDMPEGSWDMASTRKPGTVMPGFDSDFWKVYGNKLRVFGTQEGFAVLDASS